MKYEEAVLYFHRPIDLARALQLDRRTVDCWRRRRIPSRWQVQLETITGGVLTADEQARSDAELFAGYNRARQEEAA